jgi:Mg2+ and Co2+ transporter CorA
MEETREKIELFRNYYLVCFRSFDQDQYSPTYLEPINYYIVVFREGILSVRTFLLSPCVWSERTGADNHPVSFPSISTPPECQATY